MALVGTAAVISSPLLKNEYSTGQERSSSSTKPKEAERYGLTTFEADSLRDKYGYNELPTINVPLWWVFFVQFTGTMPYVSKYLKLKQIIHFID